MTYIYDLQLFAEISNINTTTGFTNTSGTEFSGFDAQHDLSAGMKTYYDGEILENARPELVYEQFANKKKLPMHEGTSVEWHKWNQLPLAERLIEGVIPKGQKFGQTVVRDTIYEFGLFVPVSDKVDRHNVDPVLLGVAQELSATGAKTMDMLVRNGAMIGTNVLYCEKVENGVAIEVTSRADMTNANNRLTPDMVNQAYTILRKADAPTINGKYVAVIHPSVAYDLRSSDEWVRVKEYSDPTDVYSGEIGELHGVRFTVSNNAKVSKGETIDKTVSAYDPAKKTAAATAGHTTRYAVTLSEADPNLTDLVGRDVYIKTAGEISQNKIVGADDKSNSLFLEGECQADMGAGAKIIGYGGNGEGGAVYSTLIMGRDAYGTIDPDGGNMQFIYKDAKTAGGPLNQFSTSAIKFSTNGAKILYENRLVRVESCSKYSDRDEAN